MFVSEYLGLCTCFCCSRKTFDTEKLYEILFLKTDSI